MHQKEGFTNTSPKLRRGRPSYGDEGERGSASYSTSGKASPLQTTVRRDFYSKGGWSEALRSLGSDTARDSAYVGGNWQYLERRWIQLGSVCRWGIPQESLDPPRLPG